MSYPTDTLNDPQLREILKSGGVGFMPSDTIYGLSCRALDRQAVERVYRLKRRDSDKPLIILIADSAQLKDLGVDPAQTAIMAGYWPGPISLECDVTTAPAWLNRGQKHEAFRVPDVTALRRLIKQVGPIVSTSANLQGGTPATTVAEAKKYFGDNLDFYVDSGSLKGRLPSTLARNNDGKLEVVRPGAVKLRERP